MSTWPALPLNPVECGFSPRMVLLPNTSARAGIAYLPLNTVTKCAKDTKCGGRSPA